VTGQKAGKVRQRNGRYALQKKDDVKRGRDEVMADAELLLTFA
jgi:hypothetical protein